MTTTRGAALAALFSVGCAMDPLIERCHAGEPAACELACERGVPGDGGCQTSGQLADRPIRQLLEQGVDPYSSTRRAQMLPLLERALAYYERACDGGAVDSCQRAASLLSERGLEHWPGAAGVRRRRFLERACTIMSQGTAVATTGEERWTLMDHHPCAELAAMLLGDDEAGSRRAYVGACAHETDRGVCMVKYDERVAQARRLSSRCQAPKLEGKGFDGELTNERLDACSALATLLDPLRARVLATAVCAARDLDDSMCQEGRWWGDSQHALGRPAAPREARLCEPVKVGTVAAPAATAPPAGGSRPSEESHWPSVELGSALGDLKVEGALDASRVRPVLEQAQPALRECYEKVLADQQVWAWWNRHIDLQPRPCNDSLGFDFDPNQAFRGWFELTLTIDAMGVVSQAFVVRYADFGACIESRVKPNLCFERATTGKRTSVTQRLELRPGTGIPCGVRLGWP